MDWFEPMEPILTNTIMKGDQWIHQVKWDGIRCLAYKDGNNVRLFTKRGRERSRWYPEITKEILDLNCKQVVLDGELIVPDEYGKPSFHNIMARDRVSRIDRLRQYIEKYPVWYMVFDILCKEGQDLRVLPLLERKRMLDETLKSNGNVQAVSDYSDGEALFSIMKEKDMEGIVSKKADSPYIGGKKHKMWFKTKIIKQMTATVCGVKVKDYRVKSLVIAENRDGKLVPVGNVSSGLSDKDKITLFNVLPQLAADAAGLYGNVKSDDVIWVKPVLKVIVSFIEREENGSLRHPVLVGFTDEKTE